MSGIPSSAASTSAPGPGAPESPSRLGPASRLFRSLRSFDARAILLVWAAWLCLALVVETDHYEVSTPQRLYYSVYNVAAGALVGFYLFDRLAGDGLARFVLPAALAILFGALLNESLVEPVAFGAEPINIEGVYYGLMESLSLSGLFLLLRLARLPPALRHRAEPAPRAPAGADPARPLTGPGAAAGCIFVRIAGGTRRIEAREILYMAAERDFTRIVCANGEHFVSESLKSLAGRSTGMGLVRVHKSFAVNLARVERLARTEAQLGDCRVPVGRSYYRAVAESWSGRPAPAAAH